MSDPIPLDELPAHLRALANDMIRVGAALQYYGGFGALSEWGGTLVNQSAPLSREIAEGLEKMRGHRA